MNLARIESRLKELLEAGALAKSASSQELQSFVAPLIDSGVLTWERSGAGERLCVRNAETLSLFILDRFPFTELEMEAEISRRIASVGRFRNSKALRSDTPDIVTVRGWSDIALWHKGKPVLISEALQAIASSPETEAILYSQGGQSSLPTSPEDVGMRGLLNGLASARIRLNQRGHSRGNGGCETRVPFVDLTSPKGDARPVRPRRLRVEYLTGCLIVRSRATRPDFRREHTLCGARIGYLG